MKTTTRSTSVVLKIFCVLFLSLMLTELKAQQLSRGESQEVINVYYNQKNLKSQKKVKQMEVPDHTVLKSGDLIIFTFNSKSSTSVSNFFQQFSKVLEMRGADEFVFADQQTSSTGYIIYRYDQYYKGIPVAGGTFLLHEKNGKLEYANGKFFSGLELSVSPTISKEKSIEQAKKSVGTMVFSWEDTKAENMLKEIKNDANATFLPRPELVIHPKENKYEKGNFRLCYKMNISALEPYLSEMVYVDAQSGEIVSKSDQLGHIDIPTLQTRTLYYGNQTMTVDEINGKFRLQESTRPIRTLDLLNSATNPGNIDLINKNNIWAPDASIINSVIIIAVNNNWKSQAGDEDIGNAPDIYIEIKNDLDQLIFSSASNVQQNATFPAPIVIDNITLIDRTKYKLKVFDDDVNSTDDLLGTYQFEKVFANNTPLLGSHTIQFAGGGTRLQITGVKYLTGALDAHWGMERVYDFYNQPKFNNRRSYDGANSPIINLLHPNISMMQVRGTDQNAAFWDINLNVMVLGNGDGVNGLPVADLDVIGHEFTHGVIGTRLNLSTASEASALNESFCDIFGTGAEHSVAGIPHNWTIGEKSTLSGKPNRNLENPKDPNTLDHGANTYHGAQWDNTLANIHANGGVQNRWFYLLVNGGNDLFIDDNPANAKYHVPAIGFDNAIRIAFHNVMDGHLTPTATYEEAYRGSLLAAASLGFANPTQEFRAVREAWFATGVALRPEISSFTPDNGPEGTTVTISGLNFNDISAVGFNETFVSFPDFAINSDNQITVEVPAGATTGLISLVAGFDTVRSDDEFTIDCIDPLVVTISSSDATSFVVDVTGGTQPYSYSLDNFITSQTSNEFTGLASGAYTVSVKDDGVCTGELTFSLSDPIECDIQSGSGGQGTQFIIQNLGSDAGHVEVLYEMFGIPDQMDIFYDDNEVATTGGLVSGANSLSFDYFPPATGPFFCVIKMSAPNPGTAWNFTALCPAAGVRMKPSDADSKSESVIYPNPASDFATLQVEGISGASMISLADITGKVRWQTDYTGNGTVSIPVKDLLAGIYIVTVKSNGSPDTSLKLVKID